MLLYKIILTFSLRHFLLLYTHIKILSSHILFCIILRRFLNLNLVSTKASIKISCFFLHAYYIRICIQNFNKYVLLQKFSGYAGLYQLSGIDCSINRTLLVPIFLWSNLIDNSVEMKVRKNSFNFYYSLFSTYTFDVWNNKMNSTYVVIWPQHYWISYTC